MADKFSATPRPTIKRVYPSLDRVTDGAVNVTTRMLWDRVHDLEERLQAQEGTASTLLTAANDHAAQLAAQDTKIRRALAVPQSPAATAAAATSAGSGSGSSGGTTATAPQSHLDIVNAAISSLGISASSTPDDLFVFVKTVVWNISQLGADPGAGEVGLLSQGGGDGTFNCSGTIYACFRLCYSNGANIKILTGSFLGQWTQEADVDPADWRPPVNPSTGCS